MMKRHILWIAVVLASLALVTAAAFPEETEGTDGPEREGKRPLIVAHRAGAANAPENTLAALERAITDGADLAEVDVRQTRDGVLVVLHDETLGRTAGLDRRVWEVDCRTVQELDAGEWFSEEFRGERVPTLRAVLEQARGRIPLMLELKPEHCKAELVGQTAALIRELGMEGQCILGSSSMELLEQVKAAAPELPTVYIGTALPQGDCPRADSYSIDADSLSKEAVARAHSQGKQICAWTVNGEEALRRAAALGVDGLVTDDPALALALYRNGTEGEAGR